MRCKDSINQLYEPVVICVVISGIPYGVVMYVTMVICVVLLGTSIPQFGVVMYTCGYMCGYISQYGVVICVFNSGIPQYSMVICVFNSGIPQYGVVIDAGSTHSQVYVYKWPGGKENGTAIPSQVYTQRTGRRADWHQQQL